MRNGKRLGVTVAALAAILLGACAAQGGSGTQTSAADAAAAVRGRAYADAHCAMCHGVGADVLESPNPDSPPFQTLADTPGLTRTALNAWLHSPHADMPSLIVAQPDIDDVSAYLASIKHHGQ